MRISKFVLLCLFLLPFLANAKNEDKAKIVTSGSNAAQCISAVHIQKIDGREARVQKMGFDLEPGKHTMSGRALINTSFCATVGSKTSRENPAPLEADFEAGKIYYVGIDHSAPSPKDWKYVIWKVKD